MLSVSITAFFNCKEYCIFVTAQHVTLHRSNQRKYDSTLFKNSNLTDSALMIIFINNYNMKLFFLI